MTRAGTNSPISKRRFYKNKLSKEAREKAQHEPEDAAPRMSADVRGKRPRAHLSSTGCCPIPWNKNSKVKKDLVVRIFGLDIDHYGRPREGQGPHRRVSGGCSLRAQPS